MTIDVSTELADLIAVSMLLTQPKLSVPKVICKMGLVEPNEFTSLRWIKVNSKLFAPETRILIHAHEANEYDPTIGVRSGSAHERDLRNMSFTITGIRGACRGPTAQDYNTMTEVETFIEYLVTHRITEAAVMTTDLHMLRTMWTFVATGAPKYGLKLWALPIPTANLGGPQRLAGTKVHESAWAVMAEELGKFYGSKAYKNFFEAGCDVAMVKQYLQRRSEAY